MLGKLEEIKKQVEEAINSIGTIEELKNIEKKYLNKEQGELVLIFHSLKNLFGEEKIENGKKANEVRAFLMEALKSKAIEIKNKEEEGSNEEWFDITIPGKKIEIGHLHPITLVRREVEEIFKSMGFNVADGPEVETQWNNFDALNFAKDHPAKDGWDTFWIKSDKAIDPDSPERLLLRPHTSPVQIRYMKEYQPPLRIIIPGRVYRNEATDASHEFQLHQVEGLMIDKDINVSNFKYVIMEFLEKFFKKEIKIRLRPSFFPFTEPSFEIDFSCIVCGGNGCRVCKQSGWVEMMGAGMVHPNVLKNAGLDSELWQGFAFGFGLDRLAMMKYKIDDIRWFNSGDLRFLKQF